MDPSADKLIIWQQGRALFSPVVCRYAIELLLEVPYALDKSALVLYVVCSMLPLILQGCRCNEYRVERLVGGNTQKNIPSQYMTMNIKLFRG
jgi:hypothetical protein